MKKETNELAVPNVIVETPKRSSASSEIVLPGNMQAFIDAPIYARTNGYLQAWYYDIGAHVKKGQLLAIIDTPEVDQQLSQAKADLNTAQANFALSQITEQRYQDLKSTDAVSKQDVDNAHGDFESKKAQVSSAQANVKRLEDLQSFTRIYAPFDGVITARNTDIGQLIDSGSGTPAKELFHIAAINTLRVFINVPQQYSTAAKPGLPPTSRSRSSRAARFKVISSAPRTPSTSPRAPCSLKSTSKIKRASCFPALTCKFT